MRITLGMRAASAMPELRERSAPAFADEAYSDAAQRAICACRGRSREELPAEIEYEPGATFQP